MNTSVLSPVLRGAHPEVFAAARALEHAGIATQVRRQDTDYEVLVPADDSDRALTLV